MSVNDTSRNGSMPTTVEESTEPVSSQEPIQARESTVLNGKPEPATTFATRADVKGVEGISKSKLILLGGGLAVAVLFFVFTAVVGRSPKKPASVRQSVSAGETGGDEATQRQRDAFDGHGAHSRARQQQWAAGAG
jgi:hypothetical protein